MYISKYKLLIPLATILNIPDKDIKYYNNPNKSCHKNFLQKRCIYY